MNFNLSTSRDYALQADMTDELINLYGILLKYVITEKVNIDSIVFCEYSHIKTDPGKIYSFYGLPETSESYDNLSLNFSNYGLTSTESINLFISKQTIDAVHPSFYESRGFNQILGNLLVLPNGRIMEITNIQFEVPGVSNLYTHSDVKNVFKLTAVPYSFRKADEIDDVTNQVLKDETGDNFDSLENYFNELVGATGGDKATDAATTENITVSIPNGVQAVPQDAPARPLLPEIDSVFGRF